MFRSLHLSGHQLIVHWFVIFPKNSIGAGKLSVFPVIPGATRMRINSPGKPESYHAQRMIVEMGIALSTHYRCFLIISNDLFTPSAMRHREAVAELID